MNTNKILKLISSQKDINSQPTFHKPQYNPSFSAQNNPKKKEMTNTPPILTICKKNTSLKKKYSING